MPSSDFDTVALVTVEENIDAFTVGLAEHETGEGAYLILQCALVPPTEQDATTGMDTYCVMDENGAVQYGGIERAELADDATLRLRFAPEAVEELGIQSPDRELALTVPAERAADLAAGLHRVLTYGNPDQQPELIGI